jgi:hypothetical protein
MHGVALRESEVTNFTRKGLLFLTCMKATILPFNSSALVLNFTAYIRDFILPQ